MHAILFSASEVAVCTVFDCLLWRKWHDSVCRNLEIPSLGFLTPVSSCRFDYKHLRHDLFLLLSSYIPCQYKRRPSIRLAGERSLERENQTCLIKSYNTELSTNEDCIPGKRHRQRALESRYTYLWRLSPLAFVFTATSGNAVDSHKSRASVR